MSVPSVPFNATQQVMDRTTNTMFRVRVWGQFSGVGVDPHEVQAIEQWIVQGLFGVLAQYGGPLASLPSIAAQWGGTVSAQLAPALAQQFQAQGQIEIHGVEAMPDGAGMGAGGYGAKAGAYGAPMAAVGAAAGGDLSSRLVMALQSQAGLPPDMANKAVSVVLSELQAAGVAVQGAGGAGKYDPGAGQKGGYDQGYGQKGAYDQGYGQKGGYDQGAAGKYDPGAGQKGYDQGYGQKGYDQGAGKYDPGAGQKGGYDPATVKGGYDPNAGYGYDPNKGGYDPNKGYGK